MSGSARTVTHCGRALVARCLGAVAAAYVLVGAPSVVHACSVCFGNPDSPHTKGMSNAILFLLAIIGGVLVALAAFFLRLRRLSRLAQADAGGWLPPGDAFTKGPPGRNGTHFGDR